MRAQKSSVSCGGGARNKTIENRCQVLEPVWGTDLVRFDSVKYFETSCAKTDTALFERPIIACERDQKGDESGW